MAKSMKKMQSEYDELVVNQDIRDKRKEDQTLVIASMLDAISERAKRGKYQSIIIDSPDGPKYIKVWNEYWKTIRNTAKALKIKGAEPFDILMDLRKVRGNTLRVMIGVSLNNIMVKAGEIEMKGKDFIDFARGIDAELDAVFQQERNLYMNESSKRDRSDTRSIKALIEEIEKFDTYDGIRLYYQQVNLWDDIYKIFFKKGERVASEEGFEKYFQSLDEIMSKIINAFIENVESDSSFKKLGYSANGLRGFPLYVYLSKYFHGVTDNFYTIVHLKSKWNKEFVDEMSLLIPELNKVLKKFKMWINTR